MMRIVIMSYLRVTIENLKADCGVGSLGGMVWQTLPRIGEHRAVPLYRLARLAGMSGMPILARLLRQVNRCIHGCDISPWADIGGGFLLPHAVGVVIGDGVAIGQGCAVYQNVTLGAKEPGNPVDYPTLGHGVRVYAGAVVLGAIHVHQGAIIGANAVVTRDVPEGAIVAGVPARVVGWATRGATRLPETDAAP